MIPCAQYRRSLRLLVSLLLLGIPAVRAQGYRPSQLPESVAQCKNLDAHTGSIYQGFEHPSCRIPEPVGFDFVECSVPKDFPLGIYLGPSQLPASYYDASGTPIHVAKVEASREWRSVALQVAQDRNLSSCYPEGWQLRWPDLEHPNCAGALPAFLESMESIVKASAAHLGRAYPLKIGIVVLPANMTHLKHLFAASMLEVFSFEPSYIPHPGANTHHIIEHTEATQVAFNLTNPDTLGAPWAEHGREVWEYAYDMDYDLIFADEDNYILLANFEPDFLELTNICVDYLNCDEIRSGPEAILELGQHALANETHSNQVQRLSSEIDAFMERTKFPSQKEKLRAVVVTGGASGMESLDEALRDALPFLESWRFKTLDDSAFVLSLGAAAKSRRRFLSQEQWDCQCDNSPSPWKQSSFHTDDEKRELGWSLSPEWPCNIRR